MSKDSIENKLGYEQKSRFSPHEKEQIGDKPYWPS